MFIPLDIIENILSEIGDDTPLLQQCSLVSSSFHLFSRKHLFSEVFIKSAQTCRRLHLVLVQNPEIPPLIRKIRILDPGNNRSSHVLSPEMGWINGDSLFNILQFPFRFLRCLEFSIAKADYTRNLYPLDWTCLRNELKAALSSIVQLSTLETLSLDGINHLPTTFFLNIARLMTLELTFLSPDLFCDENTSSLTRAASNLNLKEVMSITSQVDQCVWRFKKVEEKKYGIPFICLYLTNSGCSLPFREEIYLTFISGCHIRFLQICLNANDFTILGLDLLIRSLCRSLSTTPNPSTLEYLEINLVVKILESSFNCYVYLQTLHDSDAWIHLDLIPTYPACSRLQRVEIKIDCLSGSFWIAQMMLFLILGLTRMK
jgi:hypothetical protein